MPRKTRVTKKTAAEESDVDGYARVSTDEMAREGASLETQIEKIKLYCKLHDLRLVKLVVDPGESAKSLDRPGIREVLDDLRHGRAGGVVIPKLDRLTRYLGDWVWLIEHFFNDRANCRLHSVADSIDTRTASGRMVLNLLVTIAQWERETISERTRDTLQGKIGRGERCGKIRYGYRLAEDGVHLVPVPHEQEVIQRLQQWRAQGYTYTELVKMLEQLGIETKEGKRLWLPAAVHRILARPIA
jgi:site-specific DNA recombinase